MPPGITQAKSKSALFPVLGLGVDQLGEDAQTLFLSLVVLARGIAAPVDMLTNLWEQKVGLSARLCDCRIRPGIVSVMAMTA